MKLPNDKVEITDETVIAGDISAEGEEKDEEKDKEKVDDTTKETVSKKEIEEANTRMKRLEDSNKRLTEIFTSPEFFSKMASSMKPQPREKVEAEPTAESVQAEKDKLDAMDRQQFLAHTLSQVGKATSAAIKPEIDKLATQMSTFINTQAEGTAGTAVKEFISRVGQAEFDKYGEAMEIKAKSVRGVSMDEIYELVSGKKAPKFIQPVIPNKTQKPGEGTKESTEQKDLSMDEAASRNFDNVFGKYKTK